VTRLIILFLFSIPVSLIAQKIETDRPDQTESSAVVPKGTLQIESGANIEFIKNDLGEGVRNLHLPSTLFRVGLTNRVELRIVNTLIFEQIAAKDVTKRGRQFIDDLEAGVKIGLLNNPELATQVAFMSHLIMPLSINGSKHYGAVNKLLVSHTINESVSLGYNLGYSYLGDNNNEFTYSIALGFAISEKLGVYCEAFGDGWDLNRWNHSADAGINYLCKENIQLDYSFGSGLNHPMVYQSIGISVRLPY
jgi:hypothetical protein